MRANSSLAGNFSRASINMVGSTISGTYHRDADQVFENAIIAAETSKVTTETQTKLIKKTVHVEKRESIKSDILQVVGAPVTIEEASAVKVK